MKTACIALCLAFVVGSASASSPVAKVISLLSDLEAKVTKEGAQAKLTFQKFSVWCEDRSAELGFEIKTDSSEINELNAGIQDASAKIESFSAKIDEETSSVQTNEADLTAAEAIRATEAGDFNAKEAELTEVTSMLERAISILEREMRKGGAAMVQVGKVPGVLDAIRAILDSAALDSQDAAKLAAFVQNSQGDQGDDQALGAPAGAVYESHTGSIVDTLQDLLSKAQEQLESARKAEIDATHNFGMLKQSLTDSIKVSMSSLAESKKSMAEDSGAKATSQGNLVVTSKALAEAKTALGDLQQDCMTRSQDFESSQQARSEELKALAAAKKVISEKTGGASDLTYSLSQEAPASFLQFGRSGLQSGSDLANFEVVRLVRALAKKQHSQPLAELARRMASAVQTGTLGGADPFAKVKGLISAMITRLEKDADGEATQKAYCDKEMGETATKLDEKNAEVGKLTTKIDSAAARSAQLKSQASELQKALADLARTQSEMTKMRHEEKTDYTAGRADMEAGIEGVKMALKVLRDYYGGAGEDAAKGSSEGIIGLLEVVESDFTKGLAEMTAAENTAAGEYDQETKENAIETTTKKSDVEYKLKESKQLDAAVADASSDRIGVQEELAAILEYKDKIVRICVAKAETYGERKSRFEAELAGLKEALNILENETALLERGARRLRTVSRHIRGGGVA